MCGIVGTFKTGKYGISYADRIGFTEMLFVDQLRGRDGTGMFIVDDKEHCRTLKIGSSPVAFFSDAAFKACWDKNQGVWANGKWNDPERDLLMVGHNRLATTGEKTTQDAHPHVVDHITLVHNGTLMPYSQLPDFHKFDVDSKALTNAIAKLGIKEAIAKTFGAYAIVYYDAKEKTLNLLRNKERPLALAFDQSTERVWFASEPKMLSWIAHRNNVSFSAEPMMLKSDVLMSFELDSIKPHICSVKGPSVFHYSTPF